MVYTISPGRKISPSLIERLCSELNLTLTMRASLKSIPDSTHWHYRNGKERGVLEITLMMRDSEVILSCKENRQGNWIKSAMRQIRSDLKKE